MSVYYVSAFDWLSWALCGSLIALSSAVCCFILADISAAVYSIGLAENKLKCKKSSFNSVLARILFISVANALLRVSYAEMDEKEFYKRIRNDEKQHNEHCASCVASFNQLSHSSTVWFNIIRRFLSPVILTYVHVFYSS